MRDPLPREQDVPEPLEVAAGERIDDQDFAARRDRTTRRTPAQTVEASRYAIATARPTAAKALREDGVSMARGPAIDGRSRD